jgi:peptidoglycan/LPS O-acetylase OafA/YrhL
MERYRPHLIVLIVIVVIVLAIWLSHGVRLRIEWGTGGFVAGLLCGALLMMEVHHRRKRAEERDKK